MLGARRSSASGRPGLPVSPGVSPTEVGGANASWLGTGVPANAGLTLSTLRRWTSSMTTPGPLMAPRSCATDARLAIRISSSIVSTSAPAPVGRYVMISPCGRALRLELVERAVDRREREAHADPVEAQALLDVRAQAVLFVLGEDTEQPRIEIVLGDRADATPGALAGDLTERHEELLDLVHGLGGLALLGGEDPRVERDGLEEQVEHRRRELDPAEAQIVEHVLELVRQPRHARRAEEPGEPLERVDRRGRRR